MPTFVSPFTGTVVTPTDVSYYDLQFSTNQQLYWPSIANSSQVPAARIIDCMPSTSGLEIRLPEADQGTTGADILFRNLGADDFVVADFTGGATVTITAGQSRYFYLSDNTTSAGVWQNVVFGAGTSSADAASLQGAGLTTLAGKLAVTQNIVEISSPPTLVDSNRANTYVWTSGAGTVNLPNAANLSAGWFIAFRNNGTGALTFQPVAPATINGQSSITVNPQDSGYIVLQKSTGDFFTVGLAAPQNVTLTSAVYDVDSIVGNTFSLVSYAPIIQTYISVSGTRTQTLDVTLPAVTQLYIITNNTGASAYDITFQVSGSVQAPVVVPTGTVLLAISDGNELFTVSQTSTNQFYADDGTAAAPSYAFTNDAFTGMYLVGTSVLGLTANANQILELDGSNLLAPVITTPAEIKAGLISGGTF